MPLAVDNKYSRGKRLPGLWDSFSGVLGARSFDVKNKIKLLVGVPCLESPSGLDSQALIVEAQDRNCAAVTTAGEDINSETFDCPVDGFAFGFRRVRTAFNTAP